MNWYKKYASGNYFYVTNCVSSTAEDIDSMIDSSKEVSFEEFASHINEEDLAEFIEGAGYGPWLKIQDDYAVSFHHGTFRGVDAYYIVHSAIEYIYTLNGE